MFICGDFNGRCGDMDDFICWVDGIEQRNTVDYKTNSYGELLIDFLINVNMCILNGRNAVSNGFTSISTKGLLVVDYCLVPHDILPKLISFEVIRKVELIRRTGNVSVTAPSSIPDHSVLMREIDVSSMLISIVEEQPDVSLGKSFDKFDVKSVLP